MKPDTRREIRRVIEGYLSEGVRPSSRMIRDRLGRGSLSTITEVMNSVLEAPARGAAAGPQRTGGQEQTAYRAHPLADIGQINSENSGLLPAATDSRSNGENIDSLAMTVRQLSDELKAARLFYDEQLKLAYTRYEAVQRQALMNIDAARTESRALSEKLSTFSMDAQLREDSLRGRANSMSEQNAILRGKLEALQALVDRLTAKH